MSATVLKPVDVVTVGVGLTGSILGLELVEAGQRVVGLERGPFRGVHPDFDLPGIHDELRYAVRHELAQDVSRETLSFRNRIDQTALPMRQLGSFLPGEGLGGAAAHWNGQCWRFLPWDFETRSRTEARYGKGVFDDECTSADWGVKYEELEPFYDYFEKVFGIAGAAGNLRGAIQPDGNPYEGPRQSPYPNPPTPESYAGSLFSAAARARGFKPFPGPSANMTQPYTNPYGLTLSPCVYCGYCERFGCEMNAKASPQSALLPKLLAHPNYELRTGANVTGLKLDADRRRIVAVRYVDASGKEFEQPAELVLLTSFVFNNVKHLLLAGIGKPYDPKANTGSIGRNYAYQCSSSVTAFFDDKVFNRFIGAGSLGRCVDEFNGDNFDHAGFGFVGGGYLCCDSTGARPIQGVDVPDGTAPWGGEWKRAVAKYYDRSLNIRGHGGVQSYRANYLDLDPTYRDAYGLPLLRLTFDYRDNERRMAAYLARQSEGILHEMKPNHVNAPVIPGTYSIVPYQTTHNTGGAIMGTDPARSAVNRYLQSWQVPNLFVIGASAFPQNAGYNPTGTVGALSYWAAAAIKDRYLKQPGALA